MTRRRISVDANSSSHPRVEQRAFRGAVHLETLDAESPVWTCDLPARIEAAGTFVRLVPPSSAEAARVDAVRAALLAGGAIEVRVAPRAPAAEVPEPTPLDGGDGARSAREVIAQLVEEAHTSDREALHMFVEDVISEAGL